MVEHTEAAVMNWSPQQALDHYAALVRKRRRDDRTEYVLTRNATAAGFGGEKIDKATMEALK